MVTDEKDATQVDVKSEGECSDKTEGADSVEKSLVTSSTASVEQSTSPPNRILPPAHRKLSPSSPPCLSSLIQKKISYEVDLLDLFDENDDSDKVDRRTLVKMCQKNRRRRRLLKSVIQLSMQETKDATNSNKKSRKPTKTPINMT